MGPESSAFCFELKEIQQGFQDRNVNVDKFFKVYSTRKASRFTFQVKSNLKFGQNVDIVAAFHDYSSSPKLSSREVDKPKKFVAGVCAAS